MKICDATDLSALYVEVSFPLKKCRLILQLRQLLTCAGQYTVSATRLKEFTTNAQRGKSAILFNVIAVNFSCSGAGEGFFAGHELSHSTLLRLAYACTIIQRYACTM